MNPKHLCIALLSIVLSSSIPNAFATATHLTMFLGWQLVDNGGGTKSATSVTLGASSIGQAIFVTRFTGTNYSGRSGALLNVGQDQDGDGLTDIVEQSLGTGVSDTDSDDDGLTDFEEAGADGIYNIGIDTDPLDADTDNDGLIDGEDPNPLTPDIAERQIPTLTPIFNMLAVLLVLIMGLNISRRFHRISPAP